MKITLRDGRVIDNPEKRIREYRSVEIYKGYDDCHNINDEISMDDIDAANRLFARISNQAAENLINASDIPLLLRKIENQNLENLNDAEWKETKENLEKLFNACLDKIGVGLAVATKVLHLKRPSLIPILDSFVMQFLLDVDTSSISKRRQLRQGIKACDIIRLDLINNRETFEALQKSLSDFSIPLENVRLYDILCWSTEKWDIREELDAPQGKPRESVRPREGITEKKKSDKKKKDEKIGFAVYVDGPEDYAMIHRRNCSHYQNREGDDMDTGYWKSGFESKKDALNFAQNTGKSDVNTCGKCIK